MTEFDNVREALEQLILINESEVHNITEDGVKRKANIDDLRVINKQVLFNLADLLGMSDLYCKSWFPVVETMEQYQRSLKENSPTQYDQQVYQ